MTDKLKLCPFCGGEADPSEGQKGDGSPYYYVECLRCAATAEGAEAWNTRVPVSETGAPK